MKRCVAMIAASAAFLVTPPAAGAEEKQAAGPVEVTGCVERGVTQGCLVLKDPEKGEFSLLIGPKVDGKPEPRMAITAKGTLSSGMTTCMQGKPLEVTEWKQLRLPCPEDKKAK